MSPPRHERLFLNPSKASLFVGGADLIDTQADIRKLWDRRTRFSLSRACHFCGRSRVPGSLVKPNTARPPPAGATRT